MTVDEKLRKTLLSFSNRNSDYWSFRGKAAREHAHAYLQYPAMMVPRMQGKLIRIVRQLNPWIKNVFDPFVGSGTVMTEAMLQGLSFCGNDINPLAVLICRTKKGPWVTIALKEKIDTLMECIRSDNSNQLEVDFPNLSKWFRPDVAVELSRIRRGIRKESAKWARRFFWLALAETIRLSSNSRTSTFKLHIRPPEEVESRAIHPIENFHEIVYSNFDKLSTMKALLEERGLLNEDRFTGEVDIRLQDSAAGGEKTEMESYDLLVTSPPYGDNTSTVPYGQYSYLPLRWIDLTDIDDTADNKWLSSTCEIDRRSLGGVKANALEESGELMKQSKTFARTIDNLKDEPKDRAQRVAAFCRDLDRSLDPILNRLKKNAVMVWTVGNRSVGGRIVPTDDILTELLSARGAKHVAGFQRYIPSKRMAVRNNIAQTMRAETILVMRKCTN
ncbi:MAG: site-specific DNA-methyltransferase [bacterium]|nr:site-specific DNA-methyltransferase [bacterium]